MPSLVTLTDFIRTAAREVGFDLAGVAPVRDFKELAFFPQWIEAGYAGEMRYLESRNDEGKLKRASLANAAPWARSVIVCAMNYNTAQPRSTDAHDSSHGWVSRYAWGQQDYHDKLLAALRELESRLVAEVHDAELRTWCYVDTGPVIERVFAQHAGIGWVGKNTCIINQQLGSFLFLGVILTSLDLVPGIPAADRCGTCTRCLDVCPTNAFPAPHQLDASRCISYLTIEKRGEIPKPLRDGIGRHVFGCDLCQDVCPWNRKAPTTSALEFQPRDGLVNPSLEWLATISEEEFRTTFRGSPVKRTRRTGIRRNAIIAMGNSNDPRFLPTLERLVADPDAVVAEHAQWALDRLRRFVSYTT